MFQIGSYHFHNKLINLMKIVKEGIYSFLKSGDIKSSLGIGPKAQIEDWMKDHDVKKNDFVIREDGKIDVYGDLVLIGFGLEEFPDFINFGTIFGGFYGHGNNWKSLKGFPDEVQGDFELHASWEPRNLKNKRFTEEEILKEIDIFGNIWV